MFLTRKNINKLGQITGVYIFKKENEILYIGKSINIKARVLSHLENAKKDPKDKKLIENSDSLEFINTNFEFNALLLESKLINKYKPRFNVRWKDNKSYLYIKITRDKNYPKIFITRHERNKKDIFFGPFPSVKSVEEILRQIRKIFPFCTQKKLTNKPCFYSKIGLCNPCPNTIWSVKNKTVKNNLLKIYRRNIQFVKKTLEGKNESIEKFLYKKIVDFSSMKKYEKAIDYRNKLFLFQRLLQQHLYSDIVNYKDKSMKAINELKKILIKHFPSIKSLKRIECYDISNISYQHPTGSMVVSINGLLDKSQYRKFNIKRNDIKSDSELLQEVLKRRVRNKWNLPDLIIVDGGVPQVNASIKFFKKYRLDIPVIGIAKHPNRIIIGSFGYPHLNLKINNPGFNLIIHLRDEAHRFAKKYHLYLRNLNFLNNI